MAITTVGSLASNSGGGLATLSVSPVNVGDCWLLAVAMFDTMTVNSISGGGVTTWTRVAPNTLDAAGHASYEIWLGTITTTGSSTITLTYSKSTTFTIDLGAQEFSSSDFGPYTVWAKDVSGFQNNTTASTTITFPSLTAAGSGELYYAYMYYNTATFTPPASGGFTYVNTSPWGDLIAYNVNVSGTAAPTVTSASCSSWGDAVLITASSSNLFVPTIYGTVS